MILVGGIFMKRKLKNLAAAISAAVFAASAAVAVSAQNYYSQFDPESSKIIPGSTIQTNKPYLNITLDKGDINDSSVYFTLKRNGEMIGNFTLGMSKFNFRYAASEYVDALSGQKIQDITGAVSDEQLREKLGAWAAYADEVITRVKTEDLTSKTPLSVNPNGDPNTIPVQNWDKLQIAPNSACFFGYFDNEKYPKVSEMTVPSMSVALSVSDDYSYRYDDSAYVKLIDPNDPDNPLYSAKIIDNKGLTTQTVGRTGDFVLSLGDYYNVSNKDVNLSNVSEKYSKIRVHISELPLSCSDDGFVTGSSGEKYSLRSITYSGTDGTPLVLSYCFVSGSVITCDTPDEQGYIEIWVKDSDPYTQLHAKFNGKDSDARTGVPMPFSLIYEAVFTMMDYPSEGITLYNVLPGTYTIEMDNEKYEVTGTTSLNVIDTKNMQAMELTIRAKTPLPTPPTPPVPPDNDEENNNNNNNNSNNNNNNNSSNNNSNSNNNNNNSSKNSNSTNSSSSNSSSKPSSNSSSSKTGSSSSYKPSGNTASYTPSKTTGSSSSGTKGTSQSSGDQQAPATGAAPVLPALGGVSAALAVVSVRKRKPRK